LPGAALAALLVGCATFALGTAVGFGGRLWRGVNTNAPIGPGPNRFSFATIGIDSTGGLRLRATPEGKGYACAELFLSESLGYGRYELEVAPIGGGMDPWTVLGFYTWDADTAYANREIDIEISRWGDPARPPLLFTVQPADDRPERQASFDMDLAAAALLAFTWSPTRVSFECVNAGRTVRWSFPGRAGAMGSARTGAAPFLVPPRGSERVSLNLWKLRGAPSGAPAEVTIRAFRFTPLGE
jgi:hypothetical protein